MKNLIILMCLVALSLTTKAQVDTTAKFRNELFNKGRVTFGLKFGYTNSGIYGKDITYIFADSKTSSLSGFHAGIVVNTMLAKNFWLKHELLVGTKGAGVTLRDSISGLTYSSKLKMLSLELFPISPTFHYKGVQVYAGPYIGVLVDAQITRKDAAGNYYVDHKIYGSSEQFENTYRYLQKFDFGLSGGIEYQFKFGLLVGAKYNFGLTDIFQYANSYTFHDPMTRNIRIYNRSILLSLGYIFTKDKTWR